MTNKNCTRCGALKTLDDFSGHARAADGKQSQCKDCFAEKARLRRIGRPCIRCGKALPANAKSRAKSCQGCLDKCSQCGLMPRQNNQRICAFCQALNDKVRKSNPDAKFRARLTRIKNNFKVRPALAATLAVIDFCECCGKRASRPGEIHVDHCHKTGKVRGALCFNCNAALGHVNDSIERLQKLVAYLETKSIFKDLKDSAKAHHLLTLMIELESK